LEYANPPRPILIRKHQVQLETGYARSTIYQRMRQGLLPPPVRLGPQTVAWPADEIAAVNKARISGQGDDAIRALVSRLVAARTAQAP
jgi:prophage regulatory protein